MLKTLILSTLLSFSMLSHSQMTSTEFDQLMDQAESNQSKNEKELSVAWWLPGECWRAALEKEGFLTPEELDFFLKVLKPYTIVAVVNGTIDGKGNIDCVSEAELRKNIKLYDAEGNAHRPVNNSEVNPELIVRLSMIKPLLNITKGKWRDNYSFFIFKDVKSKGQRFFDPFGSGDIVMKIKRKEYQWETPLTALTVKTADKSMQVSAKEKSVETNEETD